DRSSGWGIGFAGGGGDSTRPATSHPHDHGGRGGELAAHPVRQRHPGVRELCSWTLAPELTHALDQGEHPSASRMVRREAAAVGVDRYGTARSDLAALHERSAL